MLQIDSVSKLYKGGEKPLITLVFSRTGRIHISNWKEWCWKDHSFRLLNGMIKPSAGSIIIDNQGFYKA